MTSIIELLIQNLPIHKKTRSGISFNCPMCISMGETRNDTRYRGGLKLLPNDSFMYHCFNCNFSTGYTSGTHISKKCLNFLIMIGVQTQEIPLDIRLTNTHNNKTDNIKKHIEYKYTEKSLPIGSRKISDLIKGNEKNTNFLEVYRYIESRGRYILSGYEYYWSPDSKNYINKRFIIPLYNNTQIIGWVGRYASNNVPNIIPKYYGDQPKNYLFNIDNMKDNVYNSIILVEGILDAISIGGIAVLGNKLTETQISILKSTKKRIILIPDRNSAGNILVNQAIALGFSVSIPEWNINLKGTEDVSAAVKKFGILYVLQTIYEAETTNKNMIITRHKLVSLM